MASKLSVFKIALKWGLLTAGITIASSILFLIFGLYDTVYRIRETTETLISIITLIVAITLVIRLYKKSNDGFLKMSEAIKIGLYLAIITSVVIIIYNLIFITVLKPDYYTEYFYGINGEKAWNDFYALNPDGHTRETYNVHAEEGFLREYQTQYPLFLIISVLISLITSSIVGFIMKKKMINGKG
ncbi:DUF4199 domain-containing protein [Aquimarina aggregata]|uniref:DUF4199 domain-containing protein n=1 Tax=Aquimarina aggregata TaxID=1642818 RepID=UPI002490C99B|nr:DUF4199 domain-containing protein [Aquimarina aggregata]